MSLPAADRGHLAAQVMHFARLLRRAGLPVGTDRVATALQALQVAGLGSRSDCHAALAACLVGRAEHRALFDQAFALFWQAPRGSAPGDAALPPALGDRAAPAPNQRLALALGLTPSRHDALAGEAPPAHDAALGWSERERLQGADFETMSADEWLQARRALARLRWVLAPQPTRRSRPSPRPGRPDWRATLAAMARHGGEMWDMRWRRPRTRPAPLVLLADISGSMSRYSRMLLHFAHTLAQADARIESFVFGTRLTRTTRLLHSRDPDLAVAQVVQAAPDWGGGTRLAGCLHEFNQRWARRVLPGPATLLLVTDGLAHGDTAALGFEMERLHKSCRHLIWLNPLLRYAGFEPRAAGIRAMLPHVDRFVPAHNLASLAQLVQLLAQPAAISSRA